MSHASRCGESVNWFQIENMHETLFLLHFHCDRRERNHKFRWKWNRHTYLNALLALCQRKWLNDLSDLWRFFSLVAWFEYALAQTHTNFHLRYIFKLNQKAGYQLKCDQNEAKICSVWAKKHVVKLSILFLLLLLLPFKSNWCFDTVRTQPRKTRCVTKNFFFCSLRQLWVAYNGSISVFILVYFTDGCKAYGLPVDEYSNFNEIHLSRIRVMSILQISKFILIFARALKNVGALQRSPTIFV